MLFATPHTDQNRCKTFSSIILEVSLFQAPSQPELLGVEHKARTWERAAVNRLVKNYLLKLRACMEANFTIFY